MSQPSNPDTPQTIEPQQLVEYASSVDGVEYIVVVSDEGFPLAFEGIDKNKAEAAAALAVDLVLASSETIKDLVGKEGREVIVDVGDGNVIDVAKAQRLILLLRGLRRPTEEVSQVLTSILEGKRTNCPHCGADLTLETYTCESCGKKMPFKSDNCPHCGAPAKIKKCPKCGGLTTSDGRIVEAVRSPDAYRLALLEGVLGAGVLGLIAAILTSNPIVVASTAIAGGGLVGMLVYKNSPMIYRIK